MPNAPSVEFIICMLKMLWQFSPASFSSADIIDGFLDACVLPHLETFCSHEGTGAIKEFHFASLTWLLFQTTL